MSANRCKCGPPNDLPAKEDVLAAMKDFDFSGVTLERICSRCNLPQFTSYRTGNDQKRIDNRRD